MSRIVYIILKMNVLVIKYFLGICKLSKKEPRDYMGMHEYIGKACEVAMKKGNITLNIEGKENIPEKDGFIFYPNHQGLFDVLVFFASCPKSFAFVIKQEVSKTILLKQIIRGTDSYPMDRKDIRGSIKVINKVTEDVKNGRNIIIFAEGTRSKMGNKMLDMKGGSFKAATNAKCPIVPCALIDSFKPFDEKGTKPITVTLKYLKPMEYEEYKDMKGTEIAAEVKRRIEAAIAESVSE